jgi:hypothetical protein
MSDVERLDLTNLFKIALDWYEQHPGEYIPDDLWGAHAKEFEDGVKWTVNAGDVVLDGTYIEIIPFVAAMALGHSSQTLLKVLDQFDVSPGDLRKTKFNQLDTLSGDSELKDRIKHKITKWNACLAVVQAVSLDDTMAHNFVVRLGYNVHPLAVACLLSPREEFWPATEINDELEEPTKIRFGMTFSTAIDSFISEETNLSELSDETVLEMLDRSGNFMIDKEIEMGMSSNFFHLLFTNKKDLHSENYQKIISAMNNAKDPAMVDKIAQKIIADLSSQQLSNSINEGLRIFDGMCRSLDRVVYAKVFDSILLKVNATSMASVDVAHRLDPESVRFEVLQDIIEPNNLLAKLSAELEALAPHQYRSQHFNALQRITSDDFSSVPIDAVDLNPLVLAALKGLEAYKTCIHTNASGTVIITHKEKAEDDLRQFLRAVTPHMKIDYSQFAGLSADTRVFLAENGFEVKKIPGTTRHDRGRMLYDQLGL